MPISVTSAHRASLSVPVSGNPGDRIEITTDVEQRVVTFTMTSAESPAAAKAKIRDFLQAARDAAQA